VTNTFVLTLDTTEPGGVAGEIDGGAAYASTQAVTLAVTTTDPDTTGYMMKVWGDVDPAADPDIQADEASSAWFTYNPALGVQLSAGDTGKTLSFRLRDDVGNANTTVHTASINLDTTLPVVTFTIDLAPDKISEVPTFDTSSGSFQSSEAVQAWKVKVVPDPSSLQDAGTTIPTTAGSTNMTGGALAALTNEAITIKGTDLKTASPGDGDKYVKVFVQDVSGSWSV
jgi:hypothetical protein